MNNKPLEYEQDLIRRLQDKQLALYYLQEALVDEDPRVFFVALKRVIEVRGIKMEDLAKSTGVNRVTLYKMLSPKGNPGFINMNKIIQALGFRLGIKEANSSLKGTVTTVGDLTEPLDVTWEASE